MRWQPSQRRTQTGQQRSTAGRTRLPPFISFDSKHALITSSGSAEGAGARVRPELPRWQTNSTVWADWCTGRCLRGDSATWNRSAACIGGAGPVGHSVTCHSVLLHKAPQDWSEPPFLPLQGQAVRQGSRPQGGRAGALECRAAARRSHTEAGSHPGPAASELHNSVAVQTVKTVPRSSWADHAPCRPL